MLIRDMAIWRISLTDDELKTAMKSYCLPLYQNYSVGDITVQRLEILRYFKLN